MDEVKSFLSFFEALGVDKSMRKQLCDASKHTHNGENYSTQ